jgi:hypothetical protein
MEPKRNDLCPCGSGKKFKLCCINKVAINAEGYEQWVNKQAKALMATCLVSSMEVLKDKFGFTQEQLNKFAAEYIPILQKNLKK